MPKFKILVIEDESILAEDIKFILESFNYEVIGIAHNTRNAIELIESNRPDLVLLDIMLNGREEGIQLAGIIKSTYNIPFIFVTAYADAGTVRKAGLTGPSGYIVKPFGEKEVYATIEITLFNNSPDEKKQEPIHENLQDVIITDSVLIKSSGEYSKVSFDDIHWLKAEGNYVEIKTINQKFLVRSTLKDFHTKLPTNKFIRIHKSFIVLKNLINNVYKKTVIINGFALPVGKKYKKEVYSSLGIL